MKLCGKSIINDTSFPKGFIKHEIFQIPFLVMWPLYQPFRTLQILKLCDILWDFLKKYFQIFTTALLNIEKGNSHHTSLNSTLMKDVKYKNKKSIHCLPKEFYCFRFKKEETYSKFDITCDNNLQNAFLFKWKYYLALMNVSRIIGVHLVVSTIFC